MKKAALAHLVQTGVIKNISYLRFNSNGHPFVTVLSGDGKSQNVYFGRKTSEIVRDNFSAKDNILEFLADATLVETENAQGEVRFKISKTPTSAYMSEVELAKTFGLPLSNNEFDLKTFKELFVGKKQVVLENSPLI